MAQSSRSRGASSLEQTVLLSVKPAYAELLVAGTKTIELRRRFPEDIARGTTMLIYASSPVQAVIGECVIASVDKLPLKELWAKSSRDAMIPWSDFRAYFSGKDHGYAITVQSAKKYRLAIPLAALSRSAGYESPASPPQSYCYVEQVL
jgi:predicted transcriptional regulator